MGLSGRKILVVGVGAGLGSATAYMLLKEGAEVVIAARSESKLKELCGELHKYGKIRYVSGDATTLEGAIDLVADAARALEGLDDLVLTIGNYIPTKISEVDENQMELMLDVNLKAPLYLIRSAIPMLKRGSGIVMISAINGMSGSATRDIAYASSKAGVAKATEVVAHELLGKGIRVNAVAPKAMGHDFKPERDWRKRRKLGDIECPPEDVANVVAFLLTKEAEWINGVVIPVDGGSRFRK